MSLIIHDLVAAMSVGTHPSWRSKCSLFDSVAVSNQEIKICPLVSAMPHFGGPRSSISHKFVWRGYMRTNRSSSKWLGVIAFSVVLVVLLVSIPKTPVSAAPPLPGAIFTTDVNGIRVNQNQYINKCDVYLSGGPGANAPPTAAGLPNGDYYFQVTDPSGKTLLSTDDVKFRQFHVSGGFITSLSGSGDHGTGDDSDEPRRITVQLCPLLNTPNPRGAYQPCVTPIPHFF